MDPEFVDLIPLFAEEARDRLERLATSVPHLDADPAAVVEAKRELHTLKGAGRMLRLGAFAELCHAAEEVLHWAPPNRVALLTNQPIFTAATPVYERGELVGVLGLDVNVDSWTKI